MPVEVGVGYVSVVPEARGFGRLLNQQIRGESASVGDRAGQDAGRGFLGGIGGVVKAGIAGVAAGAGALFAAGFAEAVEQDKSNAKLGAQLGLTEKESARAGKIAGSVYAKGYGESVDQVNDALKGLAQNGVASINAPKKELVGLSKSALALAETFDADVGESAKAVGQLIRTGLVKNGQEGFDLLTAGFQSGADKAGDLIDTVNEYSTQWRKAGLDGATAIGLINQALQAGARDGDVAADAIKEFSIRAVDGSKTTADGFKLLGLGADDMAKKFAQGGTAATGVLDVTLDRLRGIKDPVLQSQAAVALFGTQAEDLGASLLAMDPSTAAKGLGDVGGAAERMGKQVHNTAVQPLEVFKRRALQGLATFADKYALPALARFGSFLNDRVLPPAQRIGGELVNVLVPAVKGTADAFMGGVQWVKDYGAWLIPLGIAIGGVAVVAGASTIATWGMTAAFAVYRGVILAVTAVTRGWAVVQGVLNAVMSANPIGLVVVGIMALVAAAIVAYNKVGWFRDVVQATWSGIKTGWDLLWNGALRPGFGYLMTGLQAIGTAASWLWSTVLQPTFSAIGLGARILFAVIATVLITPFVIAFKALAAVGSWLWTSALQPAFAAIGAGAQWLWTSAIKPAWDGIVAGASWLWTQVETIFGWFKAGIRVLGAVGTWLYTTAIRPAFQGIVVVAGWLWTGVKVVFGWFKAGLKALGDAGTALYRVAIKPAFDGIGAAASWLWTKALKPAFDAGKAGVGLFGKAFSVAKDAIAKAWGQVSDIAKKPVNFIIEWVYSKGIKAVWDKVAGFVGLDKLPAAPKLLKDGGRTHGGIPGKDSIPALMMADEFVVKRDSARAVGFDTLNYINQHGELPVQKFADGGVVGDIAGWLGGKAKKIGGAIMDGADFIANPGKLWDKAVGYVKDRIAKIGQSRWAQVLAKFPLKMLSGLKDKIVGAAKGFLGGDDGGNIGGTIPSGQRRSIITQALAAAGVPPPGTLAQWLAGMNTLITRESGWNPRATNNWDINARNGVPSQGLAQTIPPTFYAYVPKSLRSRGILDPVANVAASVRYIVARYGNITRVQQANANRPPAGYSGGGVPRPGEIAWVGERGPELVQFGGGGRVFDHESSMQIAATEVGAGLVAAMSKRLPAVDLSAARAASAVPAATQPAAADGVLHRGDTIVVRIGEHEFQAVIDERVDAGFNDARRRKRAGARG
jgi:SLT domain-containing protein/phage-related minor tail protein